MIGYVTVGTNDLERAAMFYEAVLAELGAKRFRETPHSVYFGIKQPSFIVTTPFDGKAATVGNGTTIALFAGTIEKVNAVYAKALELKAEDEGPVGFRNYAPGFYAGYFRDLDGNKLNVFCFAR